MRKLKSIFLSLSAAALFSVLAPQSAQTLMFPPMPFDITTDIPNNVLKKINDVTAKKRKVQSKVNEIKQDALSAQKALKEGYLPEFSEQSALGQELEKPVPGTRTIEECKDIDNQDYNSVKNGIYELFMQYPGSTAEEQAAYAAKRREFYQDTLMEVYVSSRKLEERLKGIENKLNDGFRDTEQGAEQGDNVNGVWTNAYNAEVSYEQLLKVYEEFEALKAQYEAAKAMMNILPEEAPSAQKTGSYRSSETVAFAKRIVEFVEAPDSGLDSPYAANRDELERLAKLDPVYNQAMEAIEIHNLLQSMPSFQDSFVSYDRYVRMHETSIKALQLSSGCAIRHLGQYYSDPNKVWAGRDLNAQVSAHQLRGGISGWAIKAYDTAKAELSNSVSAQDLAEVDYTGIIKADTGNEYAANSNVKIDTGGLLSPSSEDEIGQIDRQTNLLSWEIGAEAFSFLAQDQYSNSPQWGGLKKKYPIWNDQKSFYNQYIEGKYENIKDYIARADLKAGAIKIVASMADAFIAEKRESLGLGSEDRSKSLANLAPAEYAKQKEILFDKYYDQVQKTAQYKKNKNEKAYQESLAAEKRLKEIYEAEMQEKIGQDELRRFDDNLQKTLKVEQDAAAKDLADAEGSFNLGKGSRDQAFAQAKSAMNNKLTPLNARKKNLNQQLDGIAKLINEYNIKINELEGRIQESTLEAQDMASQIKDINEYQGEVEDRAVIVKNVVDFEKETVVETKIDGAETVVTTTHREVIAPAETAPEKPKIYQTTTTEIKQELTPGDIKISTEELVIENAAPVQSLEDFIEEQPDSLTPIQQPENAEPEKHSYLETLAFAQGVPADKVFEITTEEKGPSELTVTEEKIVEIAVEAPIKTAPAQPTIVEYQTQEIQKDAPQKEEETVVTTYQTEEYSREFITPEESAFLTESKLQKEISLAVAAFAGKNVAQIRELVAAEKAKVKLIEEAIQKTEKDIEAVKKEYIKSHKEVEASYAEQMLRARGYAKDLLSRTVKDRLPLIKDYEQGLAAAKKVYEQEVEKYQGLLSASSAVTQKGNEKMLAMANLDLGSFAGISSQITSYISEAEMLTTEAQKRAQELIEQTKADILAMGDDIYVSSGHAKVLQRHQKLMTDLQNLPLTGIKGLSGLSAAPAVVQSVSLVYQQFLTSVACAKDACLEADFEYYIGYGGKARDLKAPKSAPSDYLPPLREVFHFDENDYGNIIQAKYGFEDGYTISEYFLDIGGKMPEIWKRVLAKDAFVEQEVDLKKLLTLGGEEMSFLDGGTYPCNNNKHTVIANPLTKNYLVTNSVVSNAYTDCQNIVVGEPFIAPVVVNGKIQQTHNYNVFDPEDETSGRADASAGIDYKILFKNSEYKGGDLAANTSELGVFLDYGINGIKLRKNVVDIFARLEYVAGELSKQETSYKKTTEDALLRRSKFDRNQIGNFLNFVDRERDLKQARDELAINIEDIKDTLVEALANVGVTIDRNFDLAKAEDYDKIKKQLESKKNEKVSLASSVLKEAGDGGGELVLERVALLQNIFLALQKDKDELITLSTNVSSGSELDEEIVSERVNREVAGAQRKKAEEELEKQIKKFEKPYCAAY